MSPATATNRDARYTWADYQSWPEDERWELIDGVAYRTYGEAVGMAAAPSIRHQDVDPLEHYAIRFVLGAEGYDKGAVVAWDEVLTFATLADVQIPLWELFGLDKTQEPL